MRTLVSVQSRGSGKSDLFEECDLIEPAPRLSSQGYCSCTWVWPIAPWTDGSGVVVVEALRWVVRLGGGNLFSNRRALLSPDTPYKPRLSTNTSLVTKL